MKARIVYLGSSKIIGFGGALKIDLSYGLYLWHMFIITFLMGGDALGNPYSMLLVFILSFSLALMSWTLIEKPAISGALGGGIFRGFNYMLHVLSNIRNYKIKFVRRR